MVAKKTNMAEQAYETLSDKILSFELPPGLVVSDHSLSQTLGMSRTPIREALARLRQEGLVEVNDRNKTMISRVTFQDIEEMFQARMAIECKAVDIIVEKGGVSKKDAARLARIHRDLMEAVRKGNVRANYEADDSFHQAIMEISGNGRLLDFFQRLRKQIMCARFLTLMAPGRFETTASEHQTLLDALVDNQSGKAKTAINRHLENSIANYRNILHQAPALGFLSVQTPGTGKPRTT